MRKYAEYMRNQVTELLTNYGKIDILWFDFSYPGTIPADKTPWMKGKGKDDWEAEKLIALARRLQPGIIIDNRTEIEQDLWTPEQFQPTEWVRHPETGELVSLGGLPDLLRQLGLLSRRADVEEPGNARCAC